MPNKIRRREVRTYKDRAQYLTYAVTKRRRKIKLMAIEYKGGKCNICGYKKYVGALDLHHVMGAKEFSIGSTGYQHSWVKIKKELDRCVLVCSNCQREIHAGLIRLPDNVLI